MAKSIKDQNRWQLWFAIAANVVAFYVLMQWDQMTASGIKALISRAGNVLPVGLAIVVTTVVNGFLSPDAKARIVFLRWTHALPGHRAFSKLALKDSRIDLTRLKKACGNKFPDNPAEQNSTWYRLATRASKRNLRSNTCNVISCLCATTPPLRLCAYLSSAWQRLSKLNPGRLRYYM